MAKTKIEILSKQDLKMMSISVGIAAKKKAQKREKQDAKFAAQEKMKEERQQAREKVEEGTGKAAVGIKVKKSQLEKAMRALLQHSMKRSASAGPLFDPNAEVMSLLFTMSETPDRRQMKPVLVPLPHPMYDGRSEVCFISMDPEKEYKELLTQKHPVPGLTKVLGLDKLRRNFNEPSQKRALADSYNLFLCDSRVVEMLPKLLGKGFYEKKKKRPIPVRFVGDDPSPGIIRAMGSTTLRVPTGPCVGVRFGRCSMEEGALVANAATVIAKVVRHLWRYPVLSISIQATESPALPIWSSESPGGELLDLRKFHSDASSSSIASKSVGGVKVSHTEGESASLLLTDGGTSQIDLDEEAGDVDSRAPANLPLLQGFKRKHSGKPSLARPLPAQSPKDSPEEDGMEPPKKKGKGKGKGKGKKGKA